MNAESNYLDVKIMGREYRVACTPEERDALLAAVDLVDGKMREIAQRGELDALVPERVWQETHRALEMPAPARFFEVWRDANALPVIFAELHALFGVPQPAQWHPEIDSGIHTLMVLEQAARLSEDPLVLRSQVSLEVAAGALSGIVPVAGAVLGWDTGKRLASRLWPW